MISMRQSSAPRFPVFLTLTNPQLRKNGLDKTLEDEVMNIEIHDAAREARIQKLLRTTGSSSVEKVLLHMVETQEEQDRWLLENRAMVNAKIKTGIDQLDRGEGIPEDQLDAHLAKLKRILNGRALCSCSAGNDRSCGNLALHQRTVQPANCGSCRNRDP